MSLSWKWLYVSDADDDGANDDDEDDDISDDYDHVDDFVQAPGCIVSARSNCLTFLHGDTRT